MSLSQTSVRALSRSEDLDSQCNARTCFEVVSADKMPLGFSGLTHIDR